MTTTTFGDATNQQRAPRSGRGGFDSSRGGRGRGGDRSRGGKGRGSAHVNGSHKENIDVSIPTTESNSWDTTAANDTPAWETSKTADDSSWGAAATGAATSTAAAAVKATSSIIPDGVKKSWASMFAPAPTPKKAPEPVEKYATVLCLWPYTDYVQTS